MKPVYWNPVFLYRWCNSGRKAFKKEDPQIDNYISLWGARIDFLKNKQNPGYYKRIATAYVRIADAYAYNGQRSNAEEARIKATNYYLKAGTHILRDLEVLYPATVTIALQQAQKCDLSPKTAEEISKDAYPIIIILNLNASGISQWDLGSKGLISQIVSLAELFEHLSKVENISDHEKFEYNFAASAVYSFIEKNEFSDSAVSKVIKDKGKSLGELIRDGFRTAMDIYKKLNFNDQLKYKHDIKKKIRTVECGGRVDDNSVLDFSVTDNSVLQGSFLGVYFKGSLLS